MLDAFFRLPRCFVSVLIDNAVRTTEKCDHVYFYIAASNSLPRLNVAPINILSVDKPQQRERDRNGEDRQRIINKAALNLGGVHDLTRKR